MLFPNTNHRGQAYVPARLVMIVVVSRTKRNQLRASSRKAHRYRGQPHRVAPAFPDRIGYVAFFKFYFPVIGILIFYWLDAGMSQPKPKPQY
ncbi:hypothetical protein [Gimesia alba]|nr:hypothetical protein [Gimesia alba]